jgi:LEA14-like dessication related protein
MKRILLPLLVLGLFTSCKKMKDPVFIGIENAKVDKLSLGSSNVTLDMRYMNPNNFNATLSSAEGDAWMDSTFLGHFVVDSSVAIPSNQEFLVPVKLAVDMKKVLQHSLTAFMNPQVTISITGTARAGRNGIFKNFPIRYSGKQDLSKIFK